MKYLVLVFFIFCSQNVSFSSNLNVALEKLDTFKLKEGDLLFQDSDCGPFCDAIEKVTFGINDSKFSHIGLVIEDQHGELVVLEAISKGVILTPSRIIYQSQF